MFSTDVTNRFAWGPLTRIAPLSRDMVPAWQTAPSSTWRSPPKLLFICVIVPREPTPLTSAAPCKVTVVLLTGAPFVNDSEPAPACAKINWLVFQFEPGPSTTTDPPGEFEAATSEM